MPISSLRELVKSERRSLEDRLEQLEMDLTSNDLTTVERARNEKKEIHAMLKHLDDETPLISALCARQERILHYGEDRKVGGNTNNEDHGAVEEERRKSSVTEISNQGLKAIKQQVTDLLTQGQLEEASQKCRDILQQGETTEVATALSHVALAYRDKRRYADAEKLIQQALAIQEHCLGTEHRAVATTLNNLGSIQVDLKELPRAEESFLRALDIWETVGGEKHPEVATQLVNLGLVLQKQGRNLDAIPLLERACRINETHLDSTHPLLLNTRNALALAYIRVCQFEMAEEQYKQVLNAVHGPGEDSVDGTRASSPVIWMTAEEAERDAKNKNKKDSISSGEDTIPFSISSSIPATSRALVDLAALYHLQGKHTAAKVLEECRASFNSPGQSSVPKH